MDYRRAMIRSVGLPQGVPSCDRVVGSAPGLGEGGAYVGEHAQVQRPYPLGPGGPEDVWTWRCDGEETPACG